MKNCRIPAAVSRIVLSSADCKLCVKVEELCLLHVDDERNLLIRLRNDAEE